MQIGSLAEASDVSAKTIRFYEQRGLIPPPPRTSGGYRDYPAEAIQRLRFIRDAQGAGMTLADIGRILSVRDNGQAPCSEVSTLIAEHLDQVERRLTELTATRTRLRRLAHRAAGIDPDACVEADICTILVGRDRLTVPSAGTPGRPLPPTTIGRGGVEGGIS
ncbi:heavy metal-responsive transcriptional regulator [Sporichthya sp.]|uniref:heavy metal-responsive transcriptional regulator n=1 Tax=Sporichthya sp. TaxID=65475 RepID=UPI0017C6E752|nr:heavy metal-responsive transcriptional regulator [Sporichthya sp.]MBA3744958.1 heavy metal-responsive transcriptional regulator [Sporichthya sp.]